MPWTVALRPRARTDMTQGADWFAEKSQTAEANWRKRLLKAITELETDPRRHPQADEAAALGMDLRELLIGCRRGIMHRILFTIDDDIVTIHRVRHAAMDMLGEDEI
jgi:plasmid stabilization system protein ParE